MEQLIESKKVTDISDPILDKIEKTYMSSFPLEERRDFGLVRKLNEENDKFSIYALCRDKQYIGFITGWDLEGFTYIEHFAIDESARNGGIGRQVMTEFMVNCSKPIVLEVELPEDEMSKRRIGFYERLGFVLDSNDYQQPPYREGGQWVNLRLMSWGTIVLKDSFKRVKQEIHKNVYNIK